MTVAAGPRRVVIEQDANLQANLPARVPSIVDEFFVQCYQRSGGRWRLIRDPRWRTAEAAVADALRFLKRED